jgi:hypothetical protein
MRGIRQTNKGKTLKEDRIDAFLLVPIDTLDVPHCSGDPGQLYGQVVFYIYCSDLSLLLLLLLK